MEQSYLIGTNAIIDYLGRKLPDTGMLLMNDVVDATPTVSIISKIEVLGFNAPPEHYKLLAAFMNDVAIIGLSDEIAQQSIELRKKYKIKLPDAIIAATAMVLDVILITRNTSDFKNIESLGMFNPWEQ